MSLMMLLWTDRCTPEVQHRQHSIASYISHCGFKQLCFVEWTFWEEELERPVLASTRRAHSLQVIQPGAASKIKAYVYFQMQPPKDESQYYFY